jgi:hypothetical protein
LFRRNPKPFDIMALTARMPDGQYPTMKRHEQAAADYER